MGRRVVPLTGDLVEDLPAPCDRCLFWELGHAPPDALLASARAADPTSALVRKQAWVSARVQEGVPPGRVVRIDDEVVAYAVFAPPDVFARRPAPAPRPSDDALLLATAHVQPAWRGHGLGRLLLQASLKEAHRLDVQAVEVYGDRRWRERSCVLPATWLLHEGFEVHGEHPRLPLLRLEVRRTARWAESLEHALEEVLGRLPGRRVTLPEPVPSPSPATDRSIATDD